MNKPLPPFSCTHSPNFPEILQQLNASLALSTYQAGKVIMLSAKDENHLSQLPRNFEKAMGIAENLELDQLALACKDQVHILQNNKELAAHYPKAPNTYDSLYVPRVTYYTSALDLHDISYGANNKLYAVNTLFSCIVELSSQYNFVPFWQPPFIDKIASEDRCHLNGMAMEDGQPRYASAFGQGNEPQSWRKDIMESGCIFDLKTNEVLCDGLAMPHTPRIINNKLYCLLSGTGELIEIDRISGKKTVLNKLNGFVRGMTYHNDYLFIGLSRLRKNSSTFSKVKFNTEVDKSGIVILHLPTNAVVSQLNYRNSVDEIYDLHLLRNKIKPNILGPDKELHKLSVATPQSTYWAKIEGND